ncbi:uncharacterized protein [Callorhinus ursinus]|uniref:uncharacterized protein isoform X2 n=1 Tax=Callorhinus ursinus TaxID=34884 RepID=UPI003CD01A4F
MLMRKRRKMPGSPESLEQSRDPGIRENRLMPPTELVRSLQRSSSALRNRVTLAPPLGGRLGSAGRRHDPLIATVSLFCLFPSLSGRRPAAQAQGPERICVSSTHFLAACFPALSPPVRGAGPAAVWEEEGAAGGRAGGGAAGFAPRAVPGPRAAAAPRPAAGEKCVGESGSRAQKSLEETGHQQNGPGRGAARRSWQPGLGLSAFIYSVIRVQSGQLWFCASDLLAWEMQMRRGFKRRETPEGTDIGSNVKNRTGSPTQSPDKKVGPVLPRSAQRFSGLSRMEGQTAGEMEKESNWVFPLGSQLL